MERYGEGKEDDPFDGIGNLGADAIAGKESGANQIRLGGRVGGEFAIEYPRDASGFRKEIVGAGGGGSKKSSDNLRSHSSFVIISGTDPLFLSLQDFPLSFSC